MPETEEIESLKKKINELETRVGQDSSMETQFRTLARLGYILNSTLNPKEVQKRAMEAATELMHAEVGSLLMVDEKTNELYFEVALGDKGDQVKEIRLKMGEGFAGWVALHEEPLLIEDVEKDTRFFRKADEKSKFVTRNMICVPVKVRNRTVGVLQAINKIGGIFDKGDMELFKMLANQVAIAIENARLMEGLKQTFYETASALAEAIEKRDPYTGGHTKRVLAFSTATAEYMGLTPEQNEELRLSAILHDIGKIGIEDRVLRKPGRLDDEEFAQMKAHPKWGAEIMEHVGRLRGIIPGMKYHHERYDGKGYPDGIAGENIPLTARIISVADTFDAMTSDRPYRKGLGDDIAIAELVKFSGTQFDPGVVKAFIEAHESGKITSFHYIDKEDGPGRNLK